RANCPCSWKMSPSMLKTSAYCGAFCATSLRYRSASAYCFFSKQLRPRVRRCLRTSSMDRAGGTARPRASPAVGGPSSETGRDRSLHEGRRKQEPLPVGGRHQRQVPQPLLVHRSLGECAADAVALGHLHAIPLG